MRNPVYAQHFPSGSRLTCGSGGGLGLLYCAASRVYALFRGLAPFAFGLCELSAHRKKGKKGEAEAAERVPRGDVACSHWLQ